MNRTVEVTPERLLQEEVLTQFLIMMEDQSERMGRTPLVLVFVCSWSQ